MGLLDFLRGAIAPTAAARIGYERGQQDEEDRQRRIKREDAELARQARLDQDSADLHKAQMEWYNARADNASDGEWSKPFPATDPVTGQPGLYQQHNKTGEIRPARLGPLDTVKAAVNGAIGGTTLPPDSQDMGDQPASPPAPTTSQSPIATVKQAVTPSQGGGSLAPYTKPTTTSTRIDPNSPQGVSSRIAVDSARVANAAKAKQRYPAPSRAQTRTQTPAQQEAYFQKIATDAVKAAEQQLPPSLTGPERDIERERKAAQLLIENPATKDVFSSGMGSRHIQSANQAFKRRARVDNALYPDGSATTGTPGTSAPAVNAKPPATTRSSSSPGTGEFTDEEVLAAARAGKTTDEEIRAFIRARRKARGGE